MRPSSLLFVAFASIATASAAQSIPPREAPASGALPAARGLQLEQCFVEQTGDDAGFMMLGDGLALSVERGALRWLVDDGERSAEVRVTPVDARSAATPSGERRLPGVVSRFHGAPDDWQRAQHTWRRVRYDDLWPGIDLTLEASGQTLKATWRLEPGVDPALVRLRHDGADALHLDGDGRLVIDTAAGPIEDDAPRAWQELAGERADVPVQFTLDPRADGSVDVGYAVGAHDPALPLWIDPAVIVQAGFLGGTARDEAADVAVDAAGNVYVCGWARSTAASFPVLVGPSLVNQLASSPWGDAFVAKLDPSGTTLLYAGFIGGWDYDFANAIAVDSLGRAYVCGHTASNVAVELFPATVGPDLVQDGSLDAWVARVSADGSTLEYCGYIGGSGFEDRGLDVDVDASFRAYVVGHTDSPPASFPDLIGPSLSYGGGVDAWIARVKSDGTGLEYCGYIGGSSFDQALEVKADGAGGAWVCGTTNSDEATFPVAVGPSLVFGGSSDAFVARVKPDGSGLLWCGYVGGSGDEAAYGLDTDALGRVYVGGYTTSTAPSFPVLVGPDLSANGGYDGWVARLAADGSAIQWCGFLGGNTTDYVFALDVDAAGGAWVAGSTFSTQATFPVVGDLDATANGGKDGYVARVLPDGTALDQCGFVGGSSGDDLVGLALVPAALLPASVTQAWAVGTSTSTEASYPVVSGPDVTANGVEDAVVVSIAIAPSAWTDLGHGLAGGLGVPTNVGTGPLAANTPASLVLAGARPSAFTGFVMGVNEINLPYKGGVLVPDPSPPGFVVFLVTSPSGGFTVNTVWPSGVPSGFTFAQQWWVQDAAAVNGYSASNALRGTTP